MEVNFKLFPSQKKVLQSNSEIILMLAGRGVGKSYIASHFVLKQLIKHPQVLGFVGAPTYAQTNDLMNKITNVLAEVAIPYVIGKLPPKSWHSDLVEHKNYLSVLLPGQAKCSQIRYGTLENYEAHRGLSLGWYLIDEAALIREQAYREVLLPALRGYGTEHPYKQLLLTTPKGISNWISDMAARSDVETIRAPSKENFIEFSPKKIEQFRELMSSRQFRQEILGEIINVSSRAQFHAFSNDKIVKEELKEAQWAIASDQNIDPGVALILQYTKDKVIAFDEVYIEGGSTVQDIANALLKKAYLKGKRVALFGDAYGNNRSVISSTSYYKQLIERLMKGGIGIVDKTLKKNPPIYESRELVNAWFEKDKLFVHKRCKHLQMDLERAQYTEDFKTDKKLYDPHLSDSCAYFFWKEFRPNNKIVGRDLF